MREEQNPEAEATDIFSQVLIHVFLTMLLYVQIFFFFTNLQFFETFFFYKRQLSKTEI